MIITEERGAQIDFECLQGISNLLGKIGIPKPLCFTGSEYSLQYNLCTSYLLSPLLIPF